MSCAACSARVERCVCAVEGVEACEVNLLLGTMDVSGEVSCEKIISAVKAAGYGACSMERAENRDYGSDTDTEQKNERRKIIARLVSSALLLLPLMYIAMGHTMWSAPLPAPLAANPMAIGLCQLIISSVVLVINSKFFINGFMGALRLAPNMDTLVALGSGASFIYSVAELFILSEYMLSGDIEAAHGVLHELYFESAAMILVLITVGKLLESIAKGRTTDAIRSLMELTPKVATVIRDGEAVIVPASELLIGDTVIAKIGEHIAADGEIISGGCSVDESALTGESIPRDKSVGDKVYSGTSVTGGYATFKVTEVGEGTALSRIIDMVKSAASGKAPVAKIADKVAGVFVPVVMGIALLSAIIWLIVGEGIGFALARGISVLVISCPCALGLATPVAIMVGSGVGARCGVLFKTAAALEQTAKIKTVALDKTGTVTEGRPEVVSVIAEGIDEMELVLLASSVEEKSEHPLAFAVTEYAKSVYANEKISQSKNFASELGGVFASVDGTVIYGGNAEYISKKCTEKISATLQEKIRDAQGKGQTVLIFAEESRVLGIIAVADKIKVDSAYGVRALKKMGIDVVMLTGDNERCAEYIANEAGIGRAIAGVFPDGKANEIKRISADTGAPVCMVGDGINDAPALTQADVGMAIGRGVDVAIDSADVVLVGGSICDVATAISLGRLVLSKIKGNLFWAFLYNVIGIPLAAGAFIPLLGWSMTPMFGAMAMSVSSLFVVGNALLINLFRLISYNGTKQTNENINIKEDEKMENKTAIIKIEGMMCPHCSGRVRDALLACDGVISADVSHERGDAVIEFADGAKLEALESVITDTGYKVIK